MIEPPAEDFYTATPDLVTGHFRRKGKYRMWRPGGVNDWLMIYTQRGKGRFGYGGDGKVVGEVTALPGDIVLIRPRTLHDYGIEASLRRWDLLWSHFQPKPGWLDLLRWPPAVAGWPGLMRLRLPHPRRLEIERKFLQVHQLATGAQRRRVELAQNALEAVLLWCDTVNAGGGGIDPRVQMSMDAICADLRQVVNIDQLADDAGLSASRFAHLFCETVGMPPRQWIERQRINRARQLLQSTRLPVKEISREVGFEDPFYFSARFRKVIGKSPRAFRSRGAD